MSNYKRPLKRQIFIYCSVFFLLLCLILSVITYKNYTKSLYQSYEKRMSDILIYTASHIDTDDLANCVSTKTKSLKYEKLERFMDEIMEHFDIHYIYIVTPVEGNPNPVIMDVLTAHTIYERTYEDESYLTLGYMMEEEYSVEDAKLHLEAMKGDDIVFFEVKSAWSKDYTGLMPLADSSGNHFALIGVDVDISEINSAIIRFTTINILLILALGIVFTIISSIKINYDITEPILQLEQSVVAFAKKAHEQKDPEQLVYEPPDINKENEVESLSKSITQMTKDMRSYAINILDAEAKVSDLKTQVTYMDMMAYQDALTHVKNKAWYDKTKERINEAINEGVAEFAIVMMDLNCLKSINDTYGHERGNDYIYGGCQQICETFIHSPVYRIGGDEFVVLLEQLDYYNRDVLFQQARTAFEASAKDENRKPWERYSAALGMAIYDSNIDRNIDDVFKRADLLMYKDKQMIKAAR